MTPADLARLHAHAMAEPRPWTEAEFAALLARPEVHLSVDADALGLARTVAGETEILTLATVPAARRRGCARRHLARLEAEARARGGTAAVLEVAADNAAALGLYRSAGYREIGRRRAYYQRDNAPAADAIVMKKPLSTACGGRGPGPAESH